MVAGCARGPDRQARRSWSSGGSKSAARLRRCGCGG